MRVPAPLSPYTHELDSRGEKCAQDCPACRWSKEYKRRLQRKLRVKLDRQNSSEVIARPAQTDLFANC